MPDTEIDPQAAYAELRGRGYFKQNPKAGAAAAELVKRGVLKDLSGGSTPSPAPSTAADTRSIGSRFTDSYAPPAPKVQGPPRLKTVYDDTQDPAPRKESPILAAARRYVQSIMDATAPSALVRPTNPNAPRGLSYPEMGVAGAVAAPVSNSVRNFTQGALAPGLARMGNRDGRVTPGSALQDIFADIPGNIRAGGRAVLNDNGAELIGRQVPGLAPGTLAGDALNAATTIGTDPLNILLAPTGANLPGVRAIVGAGRGNRLRAAAEGFEAMMANAGASPLGRVGEVVDDIRTAPARRADRAATYKAYQKIAGERLNADESIMAAREKVRANRAARASKYAEEASTPSVNKGRLIKGKKANVRDNPAIETDAVPATVPPKVSVPAEEPQGGAAGILRVSGNGAGKAPPAELTTTPAEVRTVRAPANTVGVSGAAGSEGVVYTPDDNTPVAFRWRVVDADSLKPSQTDAFADAPDYPRELQPRSRDRAASVSQVADIGQNLNPARLAESPTTADGAPVIGPEGLVESGNGRTLGIRRAYNQHPSQAAAYKAAVLQQAQALGVNPAEIARMAKPVLVRERIGGPEIADLAARGTLARKMGASTVAGMSEPEVARVDGKLLRDSPALGQYTPGADITSLANNDFRRAFLSLLPENERAGLVQSDGSLSAQGVRRIRNAVLASAYDDGPTITRLTEATDDNIKRVGAAMEQTAPQIARLKQAAAAGNADPAFDITPDISTAASRLSNLRAQNETVAGYLSQGSMFGEDISPVGAELLRMFDTHKNRGKVIADTLANYARGWEALGAPDQAELFGADRPDPHAMLRAARERAELDNGLTKTAKTGDIFADNGTGPAQSGGGTPAAGRQETAVTATENAPGGRGSTRTPAKSEGAAETDVAPKKKTSRKKAQNSTGATLTTGGTASAPSTTSTSTRGSLASPTRVLPRTTLAAPQSNQAGAPNYTANPAAVAPRIDVDPLPGGDTSRKVSDIVLDLSKALGKNIETDTRSANVRTKRAGGTYSPGSQRIVIRNSNDLDTTLHDVAHYIDDRFGLAAAWSDVSKGASPFDGELIPHFSEHGSKPAVQVSLADNKAITRKALEAGEPVEGPFDISYSTDPVTGDAQYIVSHKVTGAPTTFTRLQDAIKYARDQSRFEGEALVITRAEGVAEWVRAYLVNPDAARATAPAFAAHYEATVPPPIKTALRTFGNQARQHAGLTPREKLAAVTQFAPRKKTVAETIAGYFATNDGIAYKTSGMDLFRQRFTDDIAPMVTAVREIRRATGRMGEFDLLPSDDPVLLARGLNYFAQRFDAMLTHGVTNARGERVGKPFAEVFEPLIQGGKAGDLDALNAEIEQGLLVAIHDRVLDEARKIDMEAGATIARNRQRVDTWLDKKIKAIEDAGAEALAARVKDVGIASRTRESLLNAQGKSKARGQIARGTAKRKTARGKGAVVRRVNEQLAAAERLRKARALLADSGKILPTQDVIEARVAKQTADARAASSALMHRVAAKERAKADARKGNLTGAGAGSEAADVIARADIENLAKTDPAALARYREFAANLRAQSGDALRYAVDKGRLDLTEYQKVMDDNQWYIPMQRILDEAPSSILQGPRTVARKGSGKSLVSNKHVLNTFFGSTRTIDNPLASLLEQMYGVIKEADRNEVLQKFTALVPTDRVMYDPQGIDLSAIAEKVEEGTEGAVKVFRNGEVEYWRLERGIDAAMRRVGEVVLPGMLERIGMFPAMVKRFTATKTPGYVLRNKMRDVQERLAKSRTLPPLTPKGIVQNIADHAPVTTEEERYLMRVLGGGTFEADYMGRAADFYALQAMIARSAHREASPLPAWRTKLQFARENYVSAEAVERSTRITEMRSAKRKALEAGLDEYDANLFAAGEARDLQDFMKGGTITKVANRYFAFLNAQVQGLTRLTAPVYEAYQRGGTGAGAKASVRAGAAYGAKYLAQILLGAGAAATVPYLLARNQSEEVAKEYLDFPAYLRDMFYLVNVGPNRWIALPKPHEVGVMGSAVERALDYWIGGNKNAFDGLGGSAAKAFFPIDDSVFLGGEFKVYGELLRNYDDFRGSPIIPPYENDKMLSERAGAGRASRLGQSVGQVLGVDGRKVDFAISNTVNDYGRAALIASDWGRADKPRVGTQLGRMVLGMEKDSPGTNAASVQRQTERARQAGITKDLLEPERDALNAATTNEARGAAARALRAGANDGRFEAGIDNALARRAAIRSIAGDDKDKKASISALLSSEIERLVGKDKTPTVGDIKLAADYVRVKDEILTLVIDKEVRANPGDSAALREKRIAAVRRKGLGFMAGAKSVEALRAERDKLKAGN